MASVNTIFLSQQIKCVSRRIKGVLSYEVNLDREESISYPVFLTGL